MKVRIGIGITVASVPLLLLVALYAGAEPPAQDPADVRALNRTGAGTVVIETVDGTVVENTPDGKILRATIARQPQGPGFVPTTTADGKTAYVYGGASASDPQSQLMLANEQSAALEARTLAAQYTQADSDQVRAEAKTKLREKLVAIFEFQQKRRAHEIGKIEERLGKLKETMKKRDASLDPIVDRRLDQLTGGVDELGWEETGPSALPGLYVPGTSPSYGLSAPVPVPPVAPVPPMLPGAGPARVPASK